MSFKKISFALVGLTIASFLVFSFCKPHNDGNIDQNQKNILKNMRRILSLRHFQPKELNDQYSEKVFDSYLERIDPYKRYLTQKDYDQMVKNRTKMDDDIKNLNTSFYNTSIDTLQTRIQYIRDHFSELLDHPFDFKKSDHFIVDEEQYTYPLNNKELLTKWKKIFKYATLSEIYSIIEDQEEKQENNDSTFTVKSFIEIEQEAREKVKEDYQDFFRRFLQRDKKDWFSSYVNSYAELFDPHTTYFSPKNKEDFDFGISGKLEGIGAIIQDIKGYPTIKEVVIGSPSWKQGDLEAGDKILKVTQKGEEPMSIVGMKLDDAIRLIRGKKGTTVILTVKKEDGSLKEIPIVRDIIEYDASYAKSAIIVDNHNTKYGLINLPEFYFNPNNPKDRNAATDFEKELLALKSEDIKGIIIDLRNNGGGSLATVVRIAGMFIEKGPIVQVKTQAGNERVLKDQDSRIDWNGSVVVLVNEFSASASEILAAALQDYERAVIIGSKQTFGKGTVQSFYPLNIFGNTDDLGAIKLTIQKFYRINGGSTQLEGVSSDIVLPGKFLYTDVGERDYDNALVFDKIDAARYKKWHSKINMKKIKKKSNKRIAESSNFKVLDDNAKWFNELKDRKSISLNFELYQKDKKTQEAKAEHFDSIFKNYKNGLQVKSPFYEMTLIKNDSVLAEKRKVWHENIAQDIQLEEAIHVLQDLNEQ
ncbi:MAG: carboxy terminal-processing peptidase [Flavobacteriales bacterium]